MMRIVTYQEIFINPSTEYDIKKTLINDPSTLKISESTTQEIYRKIISDNFISIIGMSSDTGG